MASKTLLRSAVACLVLVAGCSGDDAAFSFGPPEPVEIVGYFDIAMEPFISRDGQYLFFNNSNEGPNCNLHYATRVADLRFQYQGEISGVNTPELEAVPSLDRNGNFYYLETKSAFTDFITLYGGKFKNGVVEGAGPAGEYISLKKRGTIEMDSEVSFDGETLYFARACCFPGPVPTESDIYVARKRDGSFYTDENSERIMRRINTDVLEYAPATSNDELELYFTRIDLSSGSGFQTFIAERETKQDAFGKPRQIAEISSISEAPTITGDGGRLYFHSKLRGGSRIYSLTIER